MATAQALITRAYRLALSDGTTPDATQSGYALSALQEMCDFLAEEGLLPGVGTLALGTTVPVSPGKHSALVYNLALEIQQEEGVAPSQYILLKAGETGGRLRRKMDLRADLYQTGLMGRRRTFNINEG